MTIRGFLRRLSPLLVLAAVVLGGLPAAAQPYLKFSLDGRIDSEAAPFLLALEQGYLKAEGVDVTIDPAVSPQETLTRVATGTYDLGLVDINELIKFRDQNPGAAVRAVFMVENRPTYAVLARRSRGIAGPKDLGGKRIAASTTDGSLVHLLLFARLNDVDRGRLRLDTVAVPVREPMLASGQVDAISASVLTVVDLKARGVPAEDVVVLPMADYGVELYGQAIVVSAKMASERSEAVRGFLRAVVKAMQETVRDPARAVEALSRRIDGQQRSRELERLEIAISANLVTPEVKADGFGAVDMARLTRAIDQLGLVHEFRTKPKAADVFDPTFLPPLPERLPR
ncbi:ABC transporter substrate-binding protein [Rhodoplanes roseus]|nr:ABC transporter substrate-binding protein [Rhodoplanes roseus]